MNREAINAQARTVYAWYKKRRLCTTCHIRKAEPRKTRCAECLEKQRQYNRGHRAVQKYASVGKDYHKIYMRGYRLAQKQCATPEARAAFLEQWRKDNMR